jgi:hypothetical protein
VRVCVKICYIHNNVENPFINLYITHPPAYLPINRSFLF